MNRLNLIVKTVTNSHSSQSPFQGLLIPLFFFFSVEAWVWSSTEASPLTIHHVPHVPLKHCHIKTKSLLQEMLHCCCNDSMQGIEIIRGIDGMWEKIFHDTGENGWLSQEKARYCIVSLPPFSNHCQESKL